MVSGAAKPPDRLTSLRTAFTGNEKAKSKVMRAFQTLMRQENPEPEKKPGKEKKSPP